MSRALLNYERWRRANPAGEFSLFDYAHAILKEHEVPPRIVLDLARIIVSHQADGRSYADESYWDHVYLHAYVALRREAPGVAVPDDLIPSIGGLIWPRFIRIDGRIYLAEQYSETKAASLRAQGLGNDEIEFWINIFSVDGFCADLGSWTESQEEHLAEILVNAWGRKLEVEFPDELCTAQIVRDRDVGDLCVVLVQQPSVQNALRRG